MGNSVLKCAASTMLSSSDLHRNIWGLAGRQKHCRGTRSAERHGLGWNRDKRRVGLAWTYSGEKVKAQLQVHLMPTKTSNKRAIQIGFVDLLEGIFYEV